MSLENGSRLGPYEILAPIGAGGMGEVYRARDPRLNRDVAIKVLPPSLSDDADRLRRFEQEAKAAGVLNHPNITSVYDTGEHDGAPYVVQELLEGETLRAALATGRLSPRRVVDYAIGIARGLAAAHEKGIVHRDLKPENLFVTNDGQIKILDFGLAKLTEPAGHSTQTNLPTVTPGTEPGVVLGTLGYMSPEQVRGKSADHRSDIFSFGAILYEMVSGKRAFQSDSAADTMSAILKEDPPDLAADNQSISPALDRIVRHCLEKTPERRLHSAHDLAYELEALTQTSGVAAVPKVKKRFRPRRLALVAALLLAVLAGYWLAKKRAAPLPDDGATRAYRRLTQLAGAELSPSLSPDGQILAFVKRSGGKQDVWVQRAGGQNPTNLTAACDKDSYSPAFSPDGDFIAYGSVCSGGGLFLMGATGENTRRLADTGSDPAWSPDGKEIVFNTEAGWTPAGRSTTSQLWVVEVASGKTRKIFDGDAVQPSVSPHGLRIAYWGLPPKGSRRDIWTIPYRGLGKGEGPVSVTQDAALDWNPVWSADGRFLYFLSDRSGTTNLWRVSIDEQTGKPLGPAEPRMVPARTVFGFALSRDGKRLAYVSLEYSYSLERLALGADPNRSEAEPTEILQTSESITTPSLSSDGKLIVFGCQGSSQEDLFLVGTSGTGLRKLTDDAPRDRSPSFSPDGKRIVFQSDRGGGWGIWTILADGSGLQRLTPSDEGLFTPLWSPDGRKIAASNGRNVFILEVGENGGLLRNTQIADPPGRMVPVATGWTNDGRLLVSLNKEEFSGESQAAIYSFQTGAYQTMGKSMLLAGGPTFLAPSRFLFLTNEGISLADLSGQGTHLLRANPKGGSYSFVEPGRDGRALYLARINENADIWGAAPP